SVCRGMWSCSFPGLEANASREGDAARQGEAPGVDPFEEVGGEACSLRAARRVRLRVDAAVLRPEHQVAAGEGEGEALRADPGRERARHVVGQARLAPPDEVRRLDLVHPVEGGELLEAGRPDVR